MVTACEGGTIEGVFGYKKDADLLFKKLKRKGDRGVTDPVIEEWEVK